MKTLNHPKALATLRAERVRLPRRSRLEATAIKLFGMKVCVFEESAVSSANVRRRLWPRDKEAPKPSPELWTVGESPTDVFWDDGELFVEKRQLRSANVLPHELCHYIVAARGKKLDQPNWGLDGPHGSDDEILCCKLEFFFCFMSGAYSYKLTRQYMDEYNFFEEGEVGTGYQYRGPTRAEIKARFVDFIYECAVAAKTYPLARKLAKELGISFTKKAIKETWS